EQKKGTAISSLASTATETLFSADSRISVISPRNDKERLRVYVPGPHWFIRPNNTDWRYTQMLGRLGEFSEDLEVIAEHCWVQVADTNLRLVLGAAARKL